MAESRLKGINTKLDKGLYQTVQDISVLTNVALRNIFDDALRLYIAREHARNPELLSALETMKKARENNIRG